METWIIVTIVIVILASLGAAGGLTWFFIKKRSQRRANDEYTKSLVNEALLAENLEKQQKAVNDLQTTVDTSNARTDEEQQALMLQLAESQKELEQLKNNITVAVKATNSLSHVKNAADSKGIADAARDATAAELKAVEDRNKAANKTTVDALNFTTLELDKQAAELRAFKASLQSDAVKLASEVGNPSIAPPMLPDATKPSIRTIWDAAINKVATADDQDLAIKQLSELYRIVGADADELVDAAEQMNEAPVACERIYRAPFGGICPVAPVNDLAQALDNPFIRERGMVATVAHPERAALQVLASPTLIDGERLPSRVAPALGADTDALLAEIGFTAAEAERLKAAKIV
jgi:hypothetical protein